MNVFLEDLDGCYPALAGDHTVTYDPTFTTYAGGPVKVWSKYIASEGLWLFFWCKGSSGNFYMTIHGDAGMTGFPAYWSTELLSVTFTCNPFYLQKTAAVDPVFCIGNFRGTVTE